MTTYCLMNVTSSSRSPATEHDDPCVTSSPRRAFWEIASERRAARETSGRSEIGFTVSIWPKRLVEPIDIGRDIVEPTEDFVEIQTTVVVNCDTWVRAPYAHSEPAPFTRRPGSSFQAPGAGFIPTVHG